MQTFVVTKKKDIADRNEKEFEQKKISQEKYNLEHADYFNFVKQIKAKLLYSCRRKYPFYPKFFRTTPQTYPN